MALITPGNKPLIRAAAMLWPASSLLQDWMQSHKMPWPPLGSSIQDDGVMRESMHSFHTSATPHQQQVQRVATTMSVSSQLAREAGMISRQLLGSEMHKCNGQGKYSGTVKVFEQYMKHAQEAAKKNGGKMPPEWQLTEEELLLYLDAIAKHHKIETARALHNAIDTAKEMGVKVGARSHCLWIKALCREGKVLHAYDQLKMLPANAEVDFDTVLHTMVGLITASHGMQALGCGMYLLEQRSRVFKSALPEQRQQVMHHLLQTAANFRRFVLAYKLLMKAEESGEEVMTVDLLELVGSAAEDDNKTYTEVFLRLLEKRRQSRQGSAPVQIPEGALLPVLNSAARTGDTTLAVDVFNLLCENLSEPPWRPGSPATPDSWQPTPPSPYSFHAIIHSFVNAAQSKPQGPERNELLNSGFNYLYQLEAAYHTSPTALSPRHGLAFFVDALLYKPSAESSTSGSTNEVEDSAESREEGEEREGNRYTRSRALPRLEMTPDQVLQVLKTRRSSGQMVTTGMLNVVLSARSRLASTEQDMMVAAQLFDSFPTEFGVGHNIDSVNCLVKNAISTPAAVDALLRFIEDNGLQATSDTYAEMMESHIRQSNVDGFLQSMRRSIKAGFEPSSSILKDGLNLAKKLNHRDGIRRLTVELQTLGIIPVGPPGSGSQRGERDRRQGEGRDRERGQRRRDSQNGQSGAE